MSKKLKILSLDGGGIRGIIPALILAEIEARSGKRICELFDFAVGTSTGGILVAGLHVPHPDDPTRPKFSAGELARLYLDHGDEIFEKRPALQTGGGLFDENYDYKNLLGLLKKFFGEAELRDALGEIMVTSYDIERRKPFYFMSSRAKKRPESENFKLWEVARSTSAAPTYFEPSLVKWKENDRLALVDGGVFANNPATLAYTEALNILRRQRAGGDTKEFVPTIADRFRPPAEPDYFMVSIGTGHSAKPFRYEEAKNWGMARWARPILEILMQGVNESVHYQMQYILEAAQFGQPNYYRINPEIPESNSDMADGSAENRESLKKLAINWVNENSETINSICSALIGERTN